MLIDYDNNYREWIGVFIWIGRVGIVRDWECGETIHSCASVEDESSSGAGGWWQFLYSFPHLLGADMGLW